MSNWTVMYNYIYMYFGNVVRIQDSEVCSYKKTKTVKLLGEY